MMDQATAEAAEVLRIGASGGKVVDASVRWHDVEGPVF